MAVAKKTTKSSTTSKVEKKQTFCLKCRTDIDSTLVYKHRSNILAEDVSICKKCACEYANQSIQNFHEVLRILDIVFDPYTYESCLGEDNTFSAYMLRVNNPKKTIDGIKICEMRYADSPTCEQVEDINGFLMATDAEKFENITKWGENYSQAEYMKMNTSVENSIKITGRDDYSSIKAFERVARAEVQVDRVYADVTVKSTDRKSAEDTLTAIQRQAGLAYEQISKSNTDSTLGTDIRDVIENYEPFPQALEEFEDVDMIGTYIDRFFKKPILRCFGKENSKLIDEFKAIRDEIKARALKWAKKSGDDN